MNAARSEDPRPLAVWVAPRVLSHAFERMMESRGDHAIFAEPFDAAWFFGPERQTHRTWVEQTSTETVEGQMDKILEASKSGRVYSRTMAYQLGKYLNRDFVSKFQSAIQMRDPAYSLPSLYKLRPDMTETETGFRKLHVMWKMLADMNEHAPIIDAIDLQKDPLNTVNLWCDTVGIPRNEKALQWEVGYDQRWEGWKEWTKTVRTSSGFNPPPTEMPAVPNERVGKLIDSCRVYYREMEQFKLRP